MKNEFIYPTNETDWLMWVKLAFLLLFLPPSFSFLTNFRAIYLEFALGPKHDFELPVEAKATEPNCKNVVSAIYSIIVVQYKGGGTRQG